LAEANDSALEIETPKAHISAKAVRNQFKPSVGASFLFQAQSYLDALKEAGKYNPYTSENSSVNHFREFLKGEDIAFSDLTSDLPERFVITCARSTNPNAASRNG